MTPQGDPIKHPVLALALSSLPTTVNRALWEMALQAIWETLPDVHEPRFSTEECERLQHLMKAQQSEGLLRQNEVAYVSLRRLEQETGTKDPREHRAIQRFIGDDICKRFLMIRCLGVLALAWQIRRFPKRIVLTVDEFTELYKP